MATNINRGNQLLTVDWKLPIRSERFNEYMRDVIYPGIYKGLELGVVNATTVNINPGVIWFNAQSGGGINVLSVKVRTQSPFDLPIRDVSKNILYTRLTWANVDENFAEFEFIEEGEPLPINALIVGKLLFDNSNNLIGFDYSNRSRGSLDWNNQGQLTTTLVPTEDYHIPNNRWINDNYLHYDVIPPIGNKLITSISGNTMVYESEIDIGNGVVNIPYDVIIHSNLTVLGTETIIDTQTLQVEDKNIEIGKVDTPTDITADGGGITLHGSTDKGIYWSQTGSQWNSSEHWNLETGKEYRINGIKVLDSTSLGNGITSAPSLNTVATITSGDWEAGIIQTPYGGTGQSVYTDGEILIGKTNGSLEKTTLTGTTNQVNITNGDGSITLSTPQDIHTTATPTFSGLTINGNVNTNDVSKSIFVGLGMNTLTVANPNSTIEIPGNLQVSGNTILENLTVNDTISTDVINANGLSTNTLIYDSGIGTDLTISNNAIIETLEVNNNIIISENEYVDTKIKDTINVKGDILTINSSGNLARLPIGSNDTLLIADSGENTGFRYTDELETIRNRRNEFRVENTSGSTINQYKVIRIFDDGSTNLAGIREISSLDNQPFGLVLNNILNTESGYILRVGKETITGFDTTGASIGDPVYSDNTGNLTFTDTGLLVGNVLTQSANGTIFFNFGGGSGSGSDGGSLSLNVAQVTPVLDLGSPVYFDTNWNLAQADDVNTVATGIVSQKDGNNYVISFGGTITLNTSDWDAITGESGGLTPNTLYYTSAITPGRLTTPSPGITNPVIQAISSTEALILLKFVASEGGIGDSIVQNIFTGDGTTDTFTLTNRPFNDDYTIVFVGGAIQSKTKYNISGDTITFTSPPGNTLQIIVISFKSIITDVSTRKRKVSLASNSSIDLNSTSLFDDLLNGKFEFWEEDDPINYHGLFYFKTGSPPTYILKNEGAEVSSINEANKLCLYVSGNQLLLHNRESTTLNIIVKRDS